MKRNATTQNTWSLRRKEQFFATVSKYLEKEIFEIMTSTEFIIKRLEEWKGKFSGLKLTYSFDNRKQQHVIVVQRGRVYSSQEFQNEVIRLFNNFSKECPKEMLIITPPEEPREDVNTLEPSVVPNVLFEI